MTSKFPLGGRWSELYILLLMVSCNHITTVCYYFWSVILVNFAFFGDCINNNNNKKELRIRYTGVLELFIAPPNIIHC